MKNKFSKKDCDQLGDEIIFEQGKDPGEGLLRVVGDLEKVEINKRDRKITLRECYEIIFGKGRSTLLEDSIVRVFIDGREIEERRLTLVGLTSLGRPLIVVFTPRGQVGEAKRIITAWQCGRKSKELKKLLEKIPHLNDEMVRK